MKTGLNVLVLAGSRAGRVDPMAQAAGISHKALLPVCGTPMISRVITALRSVETVGRIAICIERPDVLAGIVPDDVTFIPPAAGPSASVMQALDMLGTPLLVTTADHALLQPGWVRRFVQAAQESGCDVAAGIAMEQAILRDVPGTKRTMIRLADGAFSGCNMFLFRTPAARGVIRLWQKLEADRKKPLKMARILGIGILLRFVFRRLTRADVCRRIGQLSHARVALVPLPDGRAAVDVDKPADLELVTHLLSTAAAT
ncbi:nucleotidyltransferase family protein [Komagataeibacter sp. FNDCF1]|uniref:nucleotidyltransferase family protein n=1 Tax=Komagataeibacter sp. FNDCF1 TaxID=2878681 RepID=UPI001E3F1FAD|nr:nucleotidyltransferase family protein [Komagataeibacter sp. FNDCF1]MCE2563091.1 nucleotidyltransferase family protein [Komagataeibacter sp. FNDCF1]